MSNESNPFIDVLRGGPAAFKRAADAAIGRLRVLRAEQCPACPTPSCDTAKACRSRFDAAVVEEIDQNPVCKHAPDERVNREREERRRARRDRLLVSGCDDPKILATIPAQLEFPRPPSSWFDDVFDERAYESAVGCLRHYLMRSDPATVLLVLQGPSGCGKSSLAAWALANCEGGGCWLPALSLDDGERWRARKARAFVADFLVIDDLGAENPGKDGWATAAVQSLLIARLDAPGLTIVTTNLSAAAFGARYGHNFDAENPHGTRVLSRLGQSSDWTKFGNADLRIASKRK